MMHRWIIKRYLLFGCTLPVYSSYDLLFIECLVWMLCWTFRSVFHVILTQPKEVGQVPISQKSKWGFDECAQLTLVWSQGWPGGGLCSFCRGRRHGESGMSLRSHGGREYFRRNSFLVSSAWQMARHIHFWCFSRAGGWGRSCVSSFSPRLGCLFRKFTEYPFRLT